MDAWRIGQRQARKQARAAAAITTGLRGAVQGSSLASSALPGNEYDDIETLRDTVRSSVEAERSRRYRDIEMGTIDHGNRSRYTSLE